MGEPPLSEYEVVKFLSNRGGRCTNYELVSNFRGALNHPQHQAEARLKFKDIVNTVAIVGEHQNVKYIELKKEYSLSQYIKQKQCDEFQASCSPNSSFDGSSSYSSPLSQSFQPYWRYRLSTGTPQVLPPRGSDIDLRSSPSHQTFHRSVSESTLPQDGREFGQRSPSVDERQTSKTRQHSFSARKEGVFNSSGDRFPIRKSNNVHSQSDEVFANSPGRFLAEKLSQDASATSVSLPYYYSNSTNHSINSTSYQDYSESHVGLPYIANDSRPPNSVPEYSLRFRESPHERFIHPHDADQSQIANVSRPPNFVPESSCRSQKSPHERFIHAHFADDSYVANNSLPPNTVLESSHRSRELPHERCHSIRASHKDLDSNEIQSQKQRSFTFPDPASFQNVPKKNVPNDYGKNISDYLSSSPYHADNRILSVSPSGSTTCTSNSNSRGVPASKALMYIPPKPSGSFVDYTVERDEDHDVLANPDYLRNVSKMCLEKSKANHSKNLPHKSQQSPRRPIENVNDSRQTDAFRVKTATKESTNLDEVLTKMQAPHAVPPLPPERRRKSEDTIQSVTSEVTESCENVNPTDGGKMAINKVRDRVQQFDQMEKQQRRRSSSSNKENKVSNSEKLNMEDDISISVLDPKLKRKWFVKSSQCDYHGLVALLKKEPKLAALKDITSGYTALHWAAKHGDANVIKLIAGAYKVNPNMRSNGGYTPVHLAALYKHDIIGHLLVHTYGADATLRDYDGKRADQYPQDYLRMMTGHKMSDKRPAKQRPLAAKQTISNSFMRIGSLNLRKARKSTVFASVRGNNRNRGDLKFGNAEYTRKRVSKKEILNADQKRIEEAKEDSDSAYGFNSKDSS